MTRVILSKAYIFLALISGMNLDLGLEGEEGMKWREALSLRFENSRAILSSQLTHLR